MSDMFNFTGADTIIIDDKLINDLADGNCISITFPISNVNIVDGKDGNVIVSKVEGQRIDVTIRVLVNGETDKYLTNKFYQYRNDSVGYVGFDATFRKKTGDGKGNKTAKEVIGKVGFVDKLPDTVTNTAGDVANGIAEYVIHFAKSDVSFE